RPDRPLPAAPAGGLQAARPPPLSPAPGGPPPRGRVGPRRSPPASLSGPRADGLRPDLTAPLDLAGRRPLAAIHATGAWLLPAQLPVLEGAGVQRLVCFSSTSMLAKAASPSAQEREVTRML